MVEVGEVKESPNILKIVGFWPVGNGGGFTMVHAYAAGLNDHAEVLNAVTVELAFLGLQIQIVFFETLQNFVCRLSMSCLISAVYQDIIHINGHLFSYDQVCEDRIYEHLKGDRRVGKPEVHNTEFE